MLKHTLIALMVAAIVIFTGCAHNTIQPIDGVTITAQADIDNVDAGLNIEPPKLLCAGEAKLPFPTGKLGDICDAVRSAGGEGDEAVDSGSLPEASGEAVPLSFNLNRLRPILVKQGFTVPMIHPLFIEPRGSGAVLTYKFS